MKHKIKRLLLTDDITNHELAVEMMWGLRINITEMVDILGIIEIDGGCDEYETYRQGPNYGIIPHDSYWKKCTDKESREYLIKLNNNRHDRSI